MMPITEQQKHFCHEYIKDFVVVRAMRDAGYSTVTADKSGYLLLKKPAVAAYIKKLMEAQQKRQELTADAVLAEIQKLAFSNLSDFYKWSATKKKYVLKSLEELTPEQRAAISEYKPGVHYKLYSKDAALDKLAKYFKLYNEIDATVTNFVLMPSVTYGGKEVVFEVGKPTTKNPSQKKS